MPEARREQPCADGEEGNHRSAGSLCAGAVVVVVLFAVTVPFRPALSIVAVVECSDTEAVVLDVVTNSTKNPIRTEASPKPGSLVTMDEYLYRRSGGMIGSLSQLLRGAAVLAIEDRSESITRSLLDIVPVDYAAERADTTRTAKGGRTPKQAAG